MVTARFSFPTGRYHATPWDRHVNEGAVEWPPSPWRLLRALLATWHRKCPGLDEDQARAVVACLADEPPRYWIPGAVAAHTRHYMPLRDPAKTTKVLDAFLHLAEPRDVYAQWPVEMATDDRKALGHLLSRLTYLGRAESWVEAGLVDGLPATDDLIEVGPMTDRELDPGEERVSLLAPMGTGVYEEWRERVAADRIAEALAGKREAAIAKGKDPEGVRLTKRQRASAEAGLAADLFGALHTDTADIRSHGWNRPPGSRIVDYTRPVGIENVAPAPFPPSRLGTLPTVARYALAGTVLPRLTEVVSVAEAFRGGLLSESDGAPVFSGKDRDGKPLKGHRHAFFLPEGNGPHGRITHVTVYAEVGFDAEARRGLDTLEHVWGRGVGDVDPVLLGVGRPEEFVGRDRRSGDCALLRRSRTWVSRTPFVPTRHPKAYRDGRPKTDDTGLQIGSPEHDLRRLLTARGFPEPERVEAVRTTQLGRPARWLEFRTVRRGGRGRRAGHPGAGFRIEFPAEVSGPLALGYGAHFGLGTFVPAE